MLRRRGLSGPSSPVNILPGSLALLGSEIYLLRCSWMTSQEIRPLHLAALRPNPLASAIRKQQSHNYAGLALQASQLEVSGPQGMMRSAFEPLHATCLAQHFQTFSDLFVHAGVQPMKDGAGPAAHWLTQHSLEASTC